MTSRARRGKPRARHRRRSDSDFEPQRFPLGRAILTDNLCNDWFFLILEPGGRARAAFRSEFLSSVDPGDREEDPLDGSRVERWRVRRSGSFARVREMSQRHFGVDGVSVNQRSPYSRRRGPYFYSISPIWLFLIFWGAASIVIAVVFGAIAAAGSGSAPDPPERKSE